MCFEWLTKYASLGNGFILDPHMVSQTPSHKDHVHLKILLNFQIQVLQPKEKEKEI